MRSLLRSVKKRKKSRVLGEVQVVSREEYTGLDVDSKVEMIRALVPLGLMQVEELLDEEVKALAGERYARKKAPLRGRRHGSNPGTVGLGGQRGEEKAEKEQAGGDDRRQTRPAAGARSRSALGVARHRRGPEQGTRHRPRRVGNQRTLHARHSSTVVQEFRLLRDADQCAGRVEQIDDQERQNDWDHTHLQRAGDVKRQQRRCRVGRQ